MLRTLIIEDEYNSRLVLNNFIQNYCEGVQIIGAVDSTEDAIRLIEDKSPDLIFLDIELKDGKGMKVLDHFHKPQFVTIVVTGYDEYAIELIKRNALDYILKPIVIKDLVFAVEKAKERAKELLLLNQLKDTVVKNKTLNGKIVLPHKKNQFKVINPDDVLFITAQNQYTEWHLKDQSNMIIRKPLSECQEILPEHFFRTHYSYVVNLNYVNFITTDKQSFVEIDTIKIPISFRRKKDFLQRVRNS